MARLVVQYLDIYSNLNLPKSIKYARVGSIFGYITIYTLQKWPITIFPKWRNLAKFCHTDWQQLRDSKVNCGEPEVDVIKLFWKKSRLRNWIKIGLKSETAQKCEDNAIVKQNCTLKLFFFAFKVVCSCWLRGKCRFSRFPPKKVL